jgi:AAHS family 4-hydroxybenzoate transporter-like MFS transporter
MLLDGLDTQVIGYLGPALAADWNLPRAALGPIFSASLFGLMIGLLAIAPIADRMGRKWAIVISTSLFGCFTLLTAAAQGVSDLMVYRLVAGIGLGGALPNALALTGEYCPRRRRATLVIIMFCGFSVGSILGGGLTAAIISQFGWRPVFLIGGVLPLLLVPVLVTKLPESLHFLVLKGSGSHKVTSLLKRIDPDFSAPANDSFKTGEPEARGVPVAQLFRSGRGAGTVFLWIVFFMNLLDFYFLQNWLPTILTDSGFPTRTAVLATTLLSVGGIVAGILSGPLMDRLGPYNVLAGLYACGTVFVALLGMVTTSLPAVIAATVGVGFCVSGGQKSVNALSVIFYPTAIRSTLGIGRIGSILGPLAGGWLIAYGSSTANIFRLAALPMLCASLIVFAMGLRYQPSNLKVRKVGIDEVPS